MTTDAAAAKPLPTRRDEFPVLRAITTRWMDNDQYGHVNNVVYYSYFDTAVNGYLIEASGCDVRELPAIGIVAETSCKFMSELSFPDTVYAGVGSGVDWGLDSSPPPRPSLSSRPTVPLPAPPRPHPPADERDQASQRIPAHLLGRQRDGAVRACRLLRHELGASHLP